MYSLYKIFHPEVFQGSLKKRNYFEGWYFKNVSADTRIAFAVIPGISISDDSHAFIQYIDGNSGRSSYFRYKAGDFVFDNKKFEVRIGKSLFSPEGINLELKNCEYEIYGKIDNTEVSKLPKSILRPGIMGWYAYIPGMECNHGIVSIDHKLSGFVNINGLVCDFTGGSGYIEKDWGTSFPESWIWLQCNNFTDKGTSLMISIAKIPWRGKYFMGLISFFYKAGKTELLATYNGAKVNRLRRIDDTRTEIIIEKGGVTLSAIVTKKGTGTLKAPTKGSMASYIKESLNSEVFLELKEHNSLIYSGEGNRAGYEETDNIFMHF
jgi:tocopherol cyclase